MHRPPQDDEMINVKIFIRLIKDQYDISEKKRAVTEATALICILKPQIKVGQTQIIVIKLRYNVCLQIGNALDSIILHPTEHYVVMPPALGSATLIDIISHLELLQTPPDYMPRQQNCGQKSYSI